MGDGGVVRALELGMESQPHHPIVVAATTTTAPLFPAVDPTVTTTATTRSSSSSNAAAEPKGAGGMLSLEEQLARVSHEFQASVSLWNAAIADGTSNKGAPPIDRVTSFDSDL